MKKQIIGSLIASGSLIALLFLGTAANAQLPEPGMDIDPSRTALVITDPQNDFLSPDGVSWGVVGRRCGP